ncbi:MAG TPA: sigma-70 family RNA polymerase sigma factor [Lacipirellulaceae bacterium]|jgi:RNA polymerase sigma-70 factor (ECF subfamily)
MASPTETRLSLIGRLSDRDDVEAWDEFVAIYVPLLYRLARQKGLQHSDAEELAQEVLVAVSRAVDRWEPDPARGRFRDWLFRIARNLIINFMTRRKYQSISGGQTDVLRMIEDRCDESSDELAAFNLEQRREVFRWASAKVKDTVAAATWQAFWQSSVETKPIAEVARELGMSIGSVYVARSRVMSKLRGEVSRFEADGSRG